MFGRQHLNFERALDIFKHNVGTPLTVKNFLETGNLAEKSLESTLAVRTAKEKERPNAV